LATKQAKLNLEIENYLWANDLSGMGYSEEDIASKAQALFTHLYGAGSGSGAQTYH
jgi:hypothetical protein